MQDIVLIGLGEMGDKTINQFKVMHEERIKLLNKDIKSKFSFYYISYPMNEKFDYGIYSEKLFNEFNDSNSRKYNLDVQYYLIGDLGEPEVALQIIDIGYMFQLIERNGILRKKEICAYLTFSDLLGFSEGKESQKDIISIINSFFNKTSEYSKIKSFSPSYTNKEGIKFQTIDSNGPFDRNYIFVTPGDKNVINSMTVKIFCEKIFYEIYFFDKIYNEKNQQIHSIKSDKSCNCFSTFSFVEVPRIKELQSNYLQYTFQLEILKYNLMNDVKSINKDFYKKKFLEFIELDILDTKFPYERMTNLFYDKNVEHFKKILEPYISEINLNSYVDECINRMNSVIDKIEPKFNEFLEEEMTHLVKIVKKSVTDLFKIKPLMGCFLLYDEFINAIEGNISKWENSLDERYKEIENFDLGSYLKNADEEIIKLNNRKIMNFVLFKPIKMEKIKIILSAIPFKKWLLNEIEKRLIKMLLDYFVDESKNENHPLNILKKYKSTLKNLTEYIKKHEEILIGKKKYIEELLSFFYVVSYKSKDSLNDILKKSVERNFGIHNKTNIIEYTKSYYLEWLKEQTDIYDILYAKEEYITELEQFTVKKSPNFLDIEIDINEENEFAKHVKEDVDTRLETITSKSFYTNTNNYLTEFSVVVSPKISHSDSLYEKVKEYSDQRNIETKEVENKFTLGSLLFIKEYLFMPFSDLVKKEMLEKYREINFDPKDKIFLNKNNNNNKIESIKEIEISETSKKTNPVNVMKHIRAILKEYYSEQLKVMLYKDICGVEKDQLSQEEIEELSTKVDVKKVLNLLSDDILKNVARDYNAMFFKEREKIINVIEKKILM